MNVCIICLFYHSTFQIENYASPGLLTTVDRIFLSTTKNIFMGVTKAHRMAISSKLILIGMVTITRKTRKINFSQPIFSTLKDRIVP